MKLSTLIRWTGPAAIGGGVFMVFSELSGLPVRIPYLSQEAPTGYDAVGSGLILFALTLLLVGMIGLYAGRPQPGGARVIESGTGYPRREDSEVAGEVAGLDELRFPTDRGVPRSHHGSADCGYRASPVPVASLREQNE